MTSKPQPTTSLLTQKERSSPLWFLTGFLAVVLAGLAKIAIADHFSK